MSGVFPADTDCDDREQVRLDRRLANPPDRAPRAQEGLGRDVVRQRRVAGQIQRKSAHISGVTGVEVVKVEHPVQGTQDKEKVTHVPQMERIRDIRQGPDGDIYLVTDNRDGKPTPILQWNRSIARRIE